MADPTLPCLVCGKTLSSVLPNPDINQPNDGTAFSTSGHFGSTVFDPANGTLLEVNVCDPCLVERHARVLLINDDDGSFRPWEVERDG